MLEESFTRVASPWISSLLSNHSIPAFSGMNRGDSLGGGPPERLCLTRKPPCTIWQLSARDPSCDKRIVPCGTHFNELNYGPLQAYLQRSGNLRVVELGGTYGGQDSPCDEAAVPVPSPSTSSSSSIFAQPQSSVIQLLRGGGRMDPYADEHRQLYLVRFQPPMHPVCWEVLMRAGECWVGPQAGRDDKDDPHAEHEFGCLGRCGDRCGATFCSNWGGNCLRADVCKYFLGDDCEIEGADSDWKSTCIFGFHSGGCESVRGNPAYHSETRVCGGAHC
eukprot:g11634.t1